MIEIGEPSEFQMSYDEAVMYCFCLGDGWRLPTAVDYLERSDLRVKGYFASFWLLDRVLCSVGDSYVVPVRDIKDD